MSRQLPPPAAVDDTPAPELRAAPDEVRRGSGAGAGATAQPAQPAPRAGRDLPVAVGVGVGLGALVAVSLFVVEQAFVVLAAAAVLVSVWEVAGAFAARRIAVPLPPVLVGGVGMLVSAYAGGEEALLSAFALTCLAVLVWRAIEGDDGAARDVAAGLFTAAYVPFLAGFAMLMLAADDGALRITVFILVTIASDIGGYAAGVLLGRHPMAPSVSPKKSWEGMAGSVLVCLVVGAVAVPLLLSGPWWGGALLGLAAALSATVGDLSESMLKRDLGIKDMSSLLPAHGGLMDRLDSLLPTAPVAYLLLAVLVPVG